MSKWLIAAIGIILIIRGALFLLGMLFDVGLRKLIILDRYVNNKLSKDEEKQIENEEYF